MKCLHAMLLAACLAGVHTTSAQVPGRPDPGHLRVYRDWTLFLHPTYGYLLPVPPGVRAIGVPEDAAEAVFVSPDRNFVMRAWGGRSPGSAAAALDEQWRTARSEPGRRITYQRKADTWFVVSGVGRNNQEFYEKFITRGDQVAGMKLTYPHARLRRYEPWVIEIEDGFRMAELPRGELAAAPRLRKRGAGSVEKKPPAETASREEKPEPENKIPVVPPVPPVEEESVPVGRKAVGKPGYVYSPFDDEERLIDVVGIPAGTKVKCPYTEKIFKVP